MLLHVALVRTDVSEELSASFIRVTRIGELRTTLAVTSNAAKKYQVRKVARMEFRIEDAEGEGESSVGRKWPENKARFQASVEGCVGCY
jgi:hypothetical protein